jgi:thiol-disulfide isomerase/thioredoxin
VRPRAAGARALALAAAVAAALLLLPAASEASEQPKLVRPEQYLSRVVAPRKGRVLVVGFWATWCEPCREELPDLSAAAAGVPGRDLAVVLVSLDTKRTAPADVSRTLVDHKIGFVSYLAKTHDPSLFFKAVDPAWAGKIPYTVVYGRDGRVLDRLEGRQSRDSLSRAIRGALVEPLGR